MLIIPAIDLRGGKVVRLVKGDYAKETVYSDDPAKQASEWRDKGAKLIHVVDLDGALKGKPINLDAIKKVIDVGVDVEVGGGLRNENTINKLFKMGAKRIILGTKAVEDPDFLKEMIKEYGDAIAVGIDSQAGVVKTKGWVNASNLTTLDMVHLAKGSGASTIICTDISRDGTLKGANVEGVKEILDQVNIKVILSGGIGSYADLKKAKAINNKNLVGVIVGKALYDGRIDLAEAIKSVS